MRKNHDGIDYALQIVHDFSHTVGQLFVGTWWKYLAVGIGSVATWLLPTSDHMSLFSACAGALAVDTVTGIVASLKAGKALSSARFARVLYKIVGYMAVIFVAKLLKFFPGLDQFHLPAMLAVMWLVLATESLSILENVNKLGVVLPQFLRRVLEEQVRSHGDQGPASAEVKPS